MRDLRRDIFQTLLLRTTISIDDLMRAPISLCRRQLPLTGTHCKFFNVLRPVVQRRRIKVGDKPYDYEFWMNRIRERLPRISVPLEHGDADIVLELQVIFDRCYDVGRFASDVDYQQDPPTPLLADDAVWADALLKEKGLCT